jgi:hypothetical protein
VRPSALSEKVSNEAFYGADDWRLYDLDRPKLTMATGRNRPKAVTVIGDIRGFSIFCLDTSIHISQTITFHLATLSTNDVEIPHQQRAQ